MTIWRPMRDIHLYMPEELLVELEEAAKEKYMSRAQYIRYVLDKDVRGKYPEKIDKITSEEPWRLADLDDS